MPNQQFREDINEHVLSLLWSLWSEVGVSGWVRNHQSHAIDLEPLIIFSAGYGDMDRRLRDEITDWCAQFGRFISTSRLRTLLDSSWTEFPTLRPAFEEFAATASTAGGFVWRTEAPPRAFEPTGKSRLPELSRPSLVQLRLRAIVGVTARAELLRLFMSDPALSATAADLTDEVGYTKRNVAEALERLRLAGVLQVIPVRNTKRYKIAAGGNELVRSLGELPRFFPKWIHAFRILSFIRRYADLRDGMQAAGASVQAGADLTAAEKDLRLGGWDVPPILGTGARLAEAFEEWGVRFARELAAGDELLRPQSRSSAPENLA